MRVSSYAHNGVHFDLGASRETGHANGRSGRIGFAEILAHDVVDFGKAVHVHQVDRQFDDVVQAGPGGGANPACAATW